MLSPMLLVLLELENSLNNAVKMEQAKVCYKKKKKKKKGGVTKLKYVQ